MTTTRGLTLTTTVWVVNRVHHDTADGRANALPALTAGLTPVDVGLFGVSDFTDGGAAAHVDVADFTRRQTKLRVGAVLSDQTHRGSGGAGHFGAATRAKLDRVDHGTDRDVTQWQVVAGLDVGRRTRLDDVALLELVRSDDVALGAVHEVEQRDTRGT